MPLRGPWARQCGWCVTGAPAPSGGFDRNDTNEEREVRGKLAPERTPPEQASVFVASDSVSR